MDGMKRRKGKRADGEGTIRWSTGKKLWIARLMVGYRPDGKPDIREVSSKTQGECRRKLDEMKHRRDSGLLGDPDAGRETVGTFLARWLHAIDGTIRPSSHYRYRVNVEKHLIPAIGRCKLGELRPEHLVGLYAAKRKEGLAPRTVKYMHTTIRKALALAVKWGAVPRNVAADLDAPKVPRVEIRPPTAAEVARLLETANAHGDRFAPLWTVAAYSGCREGELLGLRWGDVELDAGTIQIRRTLAGAKGGVPRFDDAKTTAGTRTLTLPPTAVAALRAQRDRREEDRERFGDAYTDLGLVFATHTGTPFLASNVIRQFKVALKRAKLPTTYRPHDPRHANASAMHAKGVPLRVMSERLGHSTPAITLTVYSHMIRGQDSEAASKIEEAFGAFEGG
jgi:integrase